MGERLLKRIQIWATGAEEANDVATGLAAVRVDLQRIYNTRLGSVPLSEHYGLPDFTTMLNSYAPPDMEKITAAMEKTTRLFEPRLLDARIQQAPRDDEFGLLRFEISGRLLMQDKTLPVVFSAVLAGDGSVRVETV